MCFCQTANHLCFRPARLPPFPVASSRRSGAADRALGASTALLGPRPCPGHMQVGRLMTLRCWQSFIPSLASRSDLPEIFFLLCLDHLRRASGAYHLVPFPRQGPQRCTFPSPSLRSDPPLPFCYPPHRSSSGLQMKMGRHPCPDLTSDPFRRSADLTRAKSPW